MNCSRYIIVNALLIQGIHNYIKNNSNKNNNKQSALAKDAATFPSAIQRVLQSSVFFS